MKPPVIRPPGRRILVAAGLFAVLAIPLAPPLASDLAAQAVVFNTQPSDTEAGQTIQPFAVRALNSSGQTDFFFSGSITVSVASGPGKIVGGQATRSVSFGSATFDDITIEESGTYTLQATASDGRTPATSEPFQISPGPPSGATSGITASPTSIPADGTSTSTITVQLRDQFGNDLETGGDTVSLAKTGGGTLPATPVDNGDGTYTGTLTSDTSPETIMVTGMVNGGAITDDATVVFTPLPPSGATSEITASPTSIPADGASTSTITVLLRDALGNPLTTGGATVALSTTLGTLGPVTDNGNGTYSATLTSSTTAGTATISGTVNGSAISDTATVDFTLVGAPTLVIQVQPSDTRVGQPISPSVVVRVVDGLGNTLTSFTGNVTAALSTRPAGADLEGDTVEPFQNGVATFDDLRIDQAGTGFRLGFTASGAAGVVSSSFDALSGAASPSQSTIVASPTTIAANGISTSTITVQLRDADGFALSSGGDDVTLSTTLGTLSSVRDVGNGSYTATLRSTTSGGTARITGTVNGADIADDATVTFAIGNADLEVEVEVSDLSPVVGGEVTYELTIRNQGPDAATGVALTHALPARLQLVSATASQGAYSSATGVWSVGSLDEGDEASLTIVVRILGA